jgi:sterol desaturase/sphingolipid hydroxylase (fatty acid hydroxylase superfamily)
MLDAATQELLYFTTPFYVLIILGEMLLSRAMQLKIYTLKDTITNLGLMAIASSLDLLLMGFFALIMSTAYALGTGEWLHGWAYWLTLLVLEDFIFYGIHFLEHHSRFFWAVHSTHHSSDTYNLTVGFRSSALQPLYRGFFFLPLALLGFHAADVYLMYSATQIWGILVHTKFIGKFQKGPLAWIEQNFLVTPSSHRVHHASNVRYLDRNMGMVFIFWDRLFGTYQEELPEEPVKYGLTKSINLDRPDDILFNEWKSIWKDATQPGLDWSTRLKYIFYPPGWSHDGRSMTSDQLRAAEHQMAHTLTPPQRP